MKVILFLLSIFLLSALPIFAQERDPELSACDYLNGGLGSDDVDKDGVNNCVDNCLFDYNPKQKDSDHNGIGDACEWRERKRKYWETTGRELRRQAHEPVNLSDLISRSSDVVIGHLAGDGWREEKGVITKIEVIRRFKDSTNPNYQQYERPMWIYIPDGGAEELVGDLLLLLKNTESRNWVKPKIYPAPLRAGAFPDEYKYFRYELVDASYGVLGSSTERIAKAEEIIEAQKKKPQANKSLERRRK